MPAAAKKKSPTRAWIEIAEEAQGYRNATIASLNPLAPEVPLNPPKDVFHMPSRLLDQSVISITKMLPEELLLSLSTGQLSAVQVSTAYLQRAALA